MTKQNMEAKDKIIFYTYFVGFLLWSVLMFYQIVNLK